MILNIYIFFEYPNDYVTITFRGIRASQVSQDYQVSEVLENQGPK